LIEAERSLSALRRTFSRPFMASRISRATRSFKVSLSVATTIDRPDVLSVVPSPAADCTGQDRPGACRRRGRSLRLRRLRNLHREAVVPPALVSSAAPSLRCSEVAHPAASLGPALHGEGPEEGPVHRFVRTA